MPGGAAGQACGWGGVRAGRSPRPHLLLREERLLELELRLPERLLPPLALARSLLPLLLLRLLLRPLEAVPRLLLLLLREDDDPDLEEEEELRDAIACSFGRLMTAGRLCSAAATRSI